MKHRHEFAAVICFCLFCLLMVAVCLVDVQAIGPAGSSVGLAGLNGTLQKVFPYKEGWYGFSESLGILSLLMIGGFGLTGLCQWIRRRNMLKVDPQILALGGMYILVGILYIFFSQVAISYRPVLTEGELFPEASFPSSHTLMAVAVWCSAGFVLQTYLRDAKWMGRLQLLFQVMTVLLVLSRLLAGVHWVTDILAGLLLGSAMVHAYVAVLQRLRVRSVVGK